jgi:flagellar basal-body rod modification protein FlgD
MSSIFNNLTAGSTASNTVASALVPRAATAKTSGAAAKDTSSSASAATDPSTITSSDFLTLLVSELQNQDPTQPTDPNAYITQLVGVNSLQQLIQINQGVSTLGGSTGSSTSNSSATQPTSAS